MENLTSPFSPISSESTDPSSIEQPIHRWSFWILGGIFLVGLGTTIGILGVKFLSQSQNQSQVSSYQDCLTAKESIVSRSYPSVCITVSGQRFTQSISEPTLSPSVTSVQESDPNRESTGSATTTNWKIYLGETGYTTDGSSIFQISYPPEWKIEKNILFPLGHLEDKGFETRIILGALGHGWEGKTETKEFPAGTAKYSWMNIGQQISAFASFEKDKNTYIIEIVNLPSAYDNKYKIIFDKILSTFKFMD